jgi:glutaredoxin 3
MLRTAVVLLAACMLLLPLTGLAATENGTSETSLSQRPVEAKKYPSIVLYSVAWCPHCREAKEYMTEHNIPFINKDVELDAKAMEELTGKYKSQGVPLIVIGNDEKILHGFNREAFEKALNEGEQKK